MSEQTPKQAMRFNSFKMPFEQIPPEVYIELCRVYGAGSVKYAALNYTAGAPFSQLFGAAMRHMMKGNLPSGEHIACWFRRTVDKSCLNSTAENFRLLV